MTDLAGTITAQDLQDRTGYDPLFLGPGVPMPAVRTDAATVRLPYLHYTVVFRPDRRFAALTALDLDGARLKSLDRADSWQLDPRLAAELQAGPPVYAHNDLDRGHLVMRASSMWGDTEDEVRRAEADTFYFTNAAPQAASFNQGREMWLGLEESLPEHAATFDRKLAVFAGPVLEAAAAEGAVPPLGEFRTFQVPIADIAVLAGLDLDQLVLVDRLGAPVTGEMPPPPGRASTTWKELGSLDDVELAG